MYDNAPLDFDQDQAGDTGEDEMMFEDYPAERLYFKIVSAAPSKKRRLHMMPGAGCSLAQEDLAISICEPIGKCEQGIIILYTCAARISAASLVSTCLFSDLNQNFDITSEHLAVHEVDKIACLSYTFAGCVSQRCSKVMSGMVASSAFPLSESGFEVPDTALDTLAVLSALQRRGLVQQEPGQVDSTCWRLTQSGMAYLRDGFPIASSHLACVPRSHVTLQDSTRYELLKQLEMGD